MLESSWSSSIRPLGKRQSNIDSGNAVNSSLVISKLRPLTESEMRVSSSGTVALNVCEKGESCVAWTDVIGELINQECTLKSNEIFVSKFFRITRIFFDSVHTR